MKRIMLATRATLAMAASRYDDHPTEIALHETLLCEPDPIFERYDIREPKRYGGSKYKMRSKRKNRDTARTKTKAARKQRNRK